MMLTPCPIPVKRLTDVGGIQVLVTSARAANCRT